MEEKERLYPMNSAELLDETFRIYKKSFWTQLFTSMLFQYSTTMIIFIPLYLFVIAGTIGFMMMAFGSTASGSPSAPLVIGIIFLVVLLVVLVAMLQSVMALGGNFSLTRQVFLGNKHKMGKAFTEGFSALLRLITVAIMQFFLLVPFLVLELIVVVALYYIFGNIFTLRSDQVFFPFVIGITATAVIFVGGFVVFVYTSLAPGIAVFEKLRFFKACKKSYLLVRGSFMKIAGIRLIFGVTAGLISSSIMYGVSFIAIPAASFDESGMMVVWVTLMTYLVSFAVSSVLQPLNAILEAVLYLNQKIKKDGYAIEVMLDELTRVVK